MLNNTANIKKKKSWTQVFSHDNLPRETLMFYDQIIFQLTAKHIQDWENEIQTIISLPYSKPGRNKN